VKLVLIAVSATFNSFHMKIFQTGCLIAL